MWTDTEQARFLELRERLQDGDPLTDVEQQEYYALSWKAVDAEDQAVAAAAEEKRLRNAEVAQVVERKRLLIAEAERALERFRAEQKAIDEELARLLPAEKFAQLVTGRSQ